MACDRVSGFCHKILIFEFRIRTNAFRTWNQDLNFFLTISPFVLAFSLFIFYFLYLSSSIFFPSFFPPSIPTCSFSFLPQQFFWGVVVEGGLLNQWFSTGSDFAFRGHLAMFGDLFGYYNRRGRGMGYGASASPSRGRWTRDSDTAKHSAMHMTVPHSKKLTSPKYQEC